MKFTLGLLISFNVQAATVLFIGDSHSVGPFGWAFDQHLRDAGHEVATFASCGSIPKWWTNGQQTTCGYFERDLNGNRVQLDRAATPLINNLLDTIKPDVVLMEFGTNYVTTPDDKFVVRDIQNFIALIKSSGSSCFFITHPDSRKFHNQISRIADLIKTAVGNDCPIFESYLVTKYPETGGDGVHYWSAQGTPIAREWAKKAFQEFLTSAGGSN